MNEVAASVVGADRAEAVQRFARELLGDLSARRAPFPGWSRAAESLCRAAAAEGDSQEQVIALLTAHAELSMRVIDMANTPPFARAGRRLSELHLAVRRLGRDNLRAAIFGWALAQLRFAPRLSPHRAELTRLWADGTAVAAAARHLMARSSELDCGQALLAGLLHNLGKYYLVARLDHTQPLLAEPALRDQLLNNWHTVVGRELARNWQLPAPVCDAIAQHQSASIGQCAVATLPALLATALLVARAPDPLADTARHLTDFSTLALTVADWEKLLQRAREEANALRVLLGD